MSSNNKVYSKGNVNVPFAWENVPGIRKEDDYRDQDIGGGRGHDINMKLPPPPVLLPEAMNRKILNVPLPPGVFQSPIVRSGSSKKDFYKEEDDPFLMAYKKCTKSSNGGIRISNKKKNSSGMSILSCKHSCSVRDDSIVRISQLPLRKSNGDIKGFKCDG